MQNTHFSRLKQVTRQAAKTLKVTIVEKFSKCFSRLKVLLARKSRDKPQKFLCTPVARPFTREKVSILSREKH